MDETLRILNLIAADAALVAFTMLLGFGYTLFNYPAVYFWGAVILAVYLIRKNTRLRRLWNWHVWFRIQRAIHRITVPVRRKTVGFLMCKVKKSVIADIIDTALREAIDTRHITYHEYRELCAKIGAALEVTDLIPRGKRWKELTDRIVRKNCAETKASVPSGLTIPGAPEPVAERKLEYLRKRNVA